MTAIVGLIHAGRVHLGGDSAGVSGWDITTRADAKVFRNGPFVFGFTTSFRMGQLIRWSLTAPTPGDGEDLDRFMCTTFVDSVRACLKAGGWAKKDSDREEGGKFLVGVRGRLFTVDTDYQVGESLDGFAAVGAGADVALGALYATWELALRPGDRAVDISPRNRLSLALEAAERFSAAVRGPFEFVVSEETQGDDGG